jgi:hypothetical protein
MRSVKKPLGRAVSAKKVRELLADRQWVKDEDFTQQMATFFKRLPSEPVYRHSDGRILHVFRDEHGNLFESSENFVLLLQSLKEMAGKPRSSHILAGRLVYGEDFIQHVPELIDQLAALLKIPTDKLDKSMDSLTVVETQVKRLGRAKCIEAPIFAGLVAYMGEVIIAQLPQSQWQMRVSYQVPDILEPWIIDPQGRICDSWSILYDMLAEPEPITLRGAVLSAIQGRAVPRPSSDNNILTAIFKKQPKE